jgi:hypothetical protein
VLLPLFHLGTNIYFFFYLYKKFRTYAEYMTPGVHLAEQLHWTYEDIGCFRNEMYQEIVVAQIVVNNMLTSFFSTLDICYFC